MFKKPTVAQQAAKQAPLDYLAQGYIGRVGHNKKIVQCHKIYGTWLRISYFLSYIYFHFTVPRVINCAINILLYLLSWNSFKGFPQFDGFSKRLTFTFRLKRFLTPFRKSIADASVALPPRLSSVAEPGTAKKEYVKFI